MKKKTLLLFGFITLIISGLTSCSTHDDDPVEVNIAFKNLPKAAQSFINEYFYNIEIVSITRELEDGITLFDVEFATGDEVVFDEEGEWQQVDAPDGKTIPDGIAPEAIVQYIETNYQGYGINEINRTGQGYKVELVTEVDLYFNFLGEYIGMGSGSNSD